MRKESVVFYYTWAGHTARMAAIIAERTGADLQEIVPEVPYPEDYDAVVKQAKQEIREGYCPPIQALQVALQPYDVVYIGTPIWWGTMAPPVAAFLRANDLRGKILLPFSTHGGGGAGRAAQEIVQMCPTAEVREMYAAYEGGGTFAARELAAWIQKNGF